MSALDSAMEWVEYAEEDFLMAKSALRRKKPFIISSCFHSQQCAEKYFKAMLISKGMEFPKTHDLVILNGICNQAGIITGLTKENLGRLSAYAVHTRYPGAQPVPEEGEEALEISGTIRKFARVFLGVGR